ncbi:hypothetical protein [Salipiger sp.]|uniref:hypothetical protein n=1 Tax=Salipiger sp. TaxID=2078585 RepID=UPI003A96D91E
MSRFPSMAAQAGINQLRVVCRTSGKPLRLGDSVLTVFSRNATETARDLMRNRDPSRWRVQIVPVDPARHSPIEDYLS